ncbi:hypothetical protein CDL12_29026 [Handroanthus impetiginosus]|uniref:BHLH domain-containing protein n=1 Tax=Handroanthus impetiginosus TaxID=429701 RepID=A0A2G9G022_9LAMI|nr:hypothetical protein CDL12_29026 [Handroanthus impetiginosus]
MEALSYYSNWGAFQQSESDMSFIDPLIQPEVSSELPPELLPFSDPWNIDNLFEPIDLLYSENNEVTPSGYNFNSLQTEPYIFQQEFEPLFNPKRQKGCNYQQLNYCDQFNPDFLNVLPPNPRMPLQDYSPLEIVAPPPLPDFPTGPPSFSSGSYESIKKENSSGSLSAQSIAARQRRRKITEKTQELGKLVPGGNKMNTAEMLQSAYKYIKYLQAQVGILESMDSYHQENGEQFEVHEEMQGLLESPLIQEKLYSSEKCLVPQKFVQELSSDHHLIKSNPRLLPLVKQEH